MSTSRMTSPQNQQRSLSPPEVLRPSDREMDTPHHRGLGASISGSSSRSTGTVSGSGGSAHSRHSSIGSGNHPLTYATSVAKFSGAESHLNIAGFADSYRSRSFQLPSIAISSQDANGPASLQSGGPISETDRPKLRGSVSDGVAASAAEIGTPASKSPHPPRGGPAGSATALPAKLTAGHLSSPLASSAFQAGSTTSPFLGSTGSVANAGIPVSSTLQPTISQPNLSTPPAGGPDTRTSLLVVNLPYKVRWQDLKDLFRRSNGIVLRADVSLSPDNRSRGFGTVLMRDQEDAVRARDTFHGFEWMGRTLEVSFEQPGNVQALLASSNASNLLRQPDAGHDDGQSGAAFRRPSVSDYAAQYSGPTTKLLQGHSFSSQNAQYYQQLSPFGIDSTGASFSSPQAVPSLPGARVPTNFPNFGGQTPGGNRMASGTIASPLGPPQIQQLRAASFSGASRRGSAQGSSLSSPALPPPFAPSQSAASPNPANGLQSLPTPPFPPPAPSPSMTSIAPGTIPTQHQLAVLSAQAAQAATAAQQARIVAEYGGMPQGSYYGRTLFVGNLSYSTQWQDLKDLFRAAGNILRADVALGPEGRSRGFGTALFGNKDEASRAVRMFHGFDHHGRHLKVHFDRFASMESPPLGVLVPARVEDYTSAFSAAQPPSNVVATGQNKTSAVPHADTQFLLQPGFQATHQGILNVGGSNPSQMSSMPGYEAMRASGQRSIQHAFAPISDGNTISQQSVSGSSFNAMGSGQYQGSSYSGAAGSDVGGSRRPSAVSVSSGQDVRSAVSSSQGYGAQTSQSFFAGGVRPGASGEASGSRRTSASGATGMRPGRIAMPSPPRIPQQVAGMYQQHHSHSNGQGQVPVPMTPGVPLTPGMPGFTFAGMPPQTPPAFSLAPFMSPGMGMMSPGIPGQMPSNVSMMPMTPGGGPPTPWQMPNYNAAPGAPLRMMPATGQPTPRGGPATNEAAFNPFFVQAGVYQQPGVPQTPHWNTFPQPSRQSQQQKQSPPSKAGAVARAAALGASSNAGTSSSVVTADTESAVTGSENLADDSYPFPVVAKDEGPLGAEERSGQRPEAVSGRPLAIPAFSSLARRASTNSPAVSPAIFDTNAATAASSKSSFGYFGAALAEQRDPLGQSKAEKDRRPSLDAGALRTPMRDDGAFGFGSSGGYFGVTSGDAISNSEALSTSDDESEVRVDAQAGQADGDMNGQTVLAASSVPLVSPSAEEMARTIAKMSIEGTALKRGSSSNSVKTGGGTSATRNGGGASEAE